MDIKSNIILYSSTDNLVNSLSPNIIKYRIEEIGNFSQLMQITNIIKKLDKTFYNINRHILSAECDCEIFEFHTPKTINIKLNTKKDIKGIVLYNKMDNGDVKIIDCEILKKPLSFDNVLIKLNPFKVKDPIIEKVSKIYNSISTELDLLHSLQRKCYKQNDGLKCQKCKFIDKCIGRMEDTVRCFLLDNSLNQLNGSEKPSKVHN